MMDYMSDFPSPNLESAIKSIVDHLKLETEQSNIPIDKLREIVVNEIDKIGGPECFGSQTGWLVYTFNALVKNTRKTLYKEC
jgi:hypothetical protein